MWRLEPIFVDNCVMEEKKYAATIYIWRETDVLLDIMRQSKGVSCYIDSVSWGVRIVYGNK